MLGDQRGRANRCRASCALYGHARPTTQGRLRATPRSSGPPWLRSGWTLREDGRRGPLAACTENGRFVRLRSRLNPRNRHSARCARIHIAEVADGRLGRSACSNASVTENERFE